MNATDYYKKLLPYAEKYVTPVTNIPAPLVVAYWSWETDFGKNNSSIKGNNHAGIKNNSLGSEYNVGMYAGYSNIDNFAKDYARVLGLSYYKNVLATARTTSDPVKITKELNKSPYAEADYNIDTIVKRYNDIAKLSGTYIPNPTPDNNITDQVKAMDNATLTKYASAGLLLAMAISSLKN